MGKGKTVGDGKKFYSEFGKGKTTFFLLCFSSEKELGSPLDLVTLGPFEDMCAKTMFSPRKPVVHPSSSQPTWLRSVAKLLDSGCEGQDWRALGGLLGYKNNKMEEFEVRVGGIFVGVIIYCRPA